MKRLISASFILLILTVSLTVFGQEEKEKESQIKREFFEKQAQEAEKERASEDAKRIAKEREAIREYIRGSDYAKSVYPSPPSKAYSIPSMSYSIDDGIYVMRNSGSSSSQLSLSKSFDGQSSDNKGTFDVDKSVRYITFSLSGSVESGAIEIIITLPNGDEMKDLTIDTSADIQYSQNIKISEEEEKYYGQWEYSVESDKAVGHYRLSIQTK